MRTAEYSSIQLSDYSESLVSLSVSHTYCDGDPLEPPLGTCWSWPLLWFPDWTNQAALIYQGVRPVRSSVTGSGYRAPNTKYTYMYLTPICNISTRKNTSNLFFLLKLRIKAEKINNFWRCRLKIVNEKIKNKNTNHNVVRQMRSRVHQYGWHSSEYFTSVPQGYHQTNQGGAGQGRQVWVRAKVTGQLHQQLKQPSWLTNQNHHHIFY